MTSLTKFSIEPVDPDDLDGLRSLWIDTHRHHQAVAPELAPYVSEDASWTARRELYLSCVQRRGLLIRARMGNAIVGYAVSVPERTHWDATFLSRPILTEIVTLAVSPSFRGKGIGRRLLSFLHEDAEQRGGPDLMLGVLPQNLDAIRLYEAFGYRRAWLLMTRLGRPAPPATSHGDGVELSPVGPHEIGALRTLWLSLHAHHQHVAPSLAPFVSAQTSWDVMRQLFEKAAHEGGLWRAGPGSDPLGLIRFGSADTTVLSDTWSTSGAVGEVNVLAVRPDQRGRGLGTCLLALATRQWAAAGIQNQMISAIAPNRRAISLYARLDFRPAWLNMTRFTAA